MTGGCAELVSETAARLSQLPSGNFPEPGARGHGFRRGASRDETQNGQKRGISQTQRTQNSRLSGSPMRT